MDNSSHLMTNFQTLTWSHFLVFMTKKIRPRNNQTNSTKASYLVSCRIVVSILCDGPRDGSKTGQTTGFKSSLMMPKNVGGICG